MKLYTEEQVRIALDLSAKGIDLVLCDDILSYVKHIELPSDEDIIKESDEWWGALSFEGGAKWVINHIKNQYNGN